MDAFSFYSTAGSYTRMDTLVPAIRQWPPDEQAVIRCIRTLMIHPEAARRLGCRFNYKARLRALVDYHDVSAILADPVMQRLLAGEGEVPPCQRAIFSCDHHVLLFVSIMRLQGRAARARCGYSATLVPGRWTPHWIAELRDAVTGQWQPLDIEQQCAVADGAFVSGSQAWLLFRAGHFDVSLLLDDYRSGADGVKYRLLSDVNALLQQECLAFEWMMRETAPQAPDLFRLGCQRLTPVQLTQLDELAQLALQDCVPRLWPVLQLAPAALRPGQWQVLTDTCAAWTGQDNSAHVAA